MKKKRTPSTPPTDVKAQVCKKPNPKPYDNGGANRNLMLLVARIRRNFTKDVMQDFYSNSNASLSEMLQAEEIN
ncbi:MAG TPA: hypothetical protein PLJ84_07730 [Bacteroidales bacterium]|nr:hypothetical protein [Bacteroidales bacterium]